MTLFTEIFAARPTERRSGVSRRLRGERRGDGRARVPFERRKGIDRRQLVGRRTGEHVANVTDAELKVLLER